LLLRRVHLGLQLDGVADDVLAHELIYSILDQENIARGHAAYYLKWADEALSDGGVAYASRGVTQVSLLPAKPARLRQEAIDNSKPAETLFARFDFVNATFAAQKAWRSAGGVPRPRARPRAGNE
jgi:hypothetical protein